MLKEKMGKTNKQTTRETKEVNSGSLVIRLCCSGL